MNNNKTIKYGKTILLSFLILTISLNSTMAQVTILSAARNNDTVTLNKLLSLHTNIDTTDLRGSTPLVIACYYENYAAAALLLRNGADPNIKDKMGNTALMGVCFKNYPDIAELLLHYRADVNIKNFNGATALIFAATFGSTMIAKELINNGADKTIRDRFGNNALHYAQDNEIMRRLLE